MFNSLMNKRAALTAKFADVKENDIQDVELRSKFRKLKAKQGGFTLLELLVVVAILAAIAGTASLALQDTDARASAAAHVAMMDELNKGIRSYRVLNKNELPNNFDSLIQTSTTDNTFTDSALLSVAAIEDVAVVDLTLPAAEILVAGGITNLRYVSASASVTPADSSVNCSNLEAVIASRANAVVAGNIFLSPAANGCGYGQDLTAVNDGGTPGDTSDDTTGLNGAPKVALWTGGFERVMGEAGSGFDTNATGAPVLMATGLGPSSTLFNANQLGGMTTVPVYRHVSETEYNRFIALWNIGTYDGNNTSGAYTAGEQVTLAAIVDGAGDTKEEELGEWDGTRNTI